MIICKWLQFSPMTQPRTNACICTPVPGHGPDHSKLGPLGPTMETLVKLEE
jgi:hypothetical protein